MNKISKFKIGHEVYFLASPFCRGTNAKFVLVDKRAVTLKPCTLSFEHAAGIPLTALTVWEALVERLEIKEGEQVAILIINGAEGVGSIAYVIDHHENIQKQINALQLDVPLKYAFITHTSVGKYAKIYANILAPFGKMCSIVQGEFDMYGTPSMAKSLTFVWELLNTKVRYGGDL